MLVVVSRFIRAIRAGTFIKLVVSSALAYRQIDQQVFNLSFIQVVDIVKVVANITPRAGISFTVARLLAAARPAQARHLLKDLVDPLLVSAFVKEAAAFWSSTDFFDRDFKYKPRNPSNRPHYYFFIYHLCNSRSLTLHHC